jgi:hypothetical protein
MESPAIRSGLAQALAQYRGWSETELPAFLPDTLSEEEEKVPVSKLLKPKGLGQFPAGVTGLTPSQSQVRQSRLFKSVCLPPFQSPLSLLERNLVPSHQRFP